jgi:hypothetical protein
MSFTSHDQWVAVILIECYDVARVTKAAQGQAVHFRLNSSYKLLARMYCVVIECRYTSTFAHYTYDYMGRNGITLS